MWYKTSKCAAKRKIWNNSSKKRNAFLAEGHLSIKYRI
jgi:hypothetical protein